MAEADVRGGDPEAAVSTKLRDCLRGAESVGAAFSVCRHYLSIDKAKLLSLALVMLLLACHSPSLYGDSCQRLLSTGRFLGNDKWQPDGCMMLSYSGAEARECLTGKNIVFIGDSRVFLLFASFVNIMTDAHFPPEAHEDFHLNISTTKVHFLWNPWTNKEMKQRLTSLTQMPVKPDAVIMGDATWIIRQYKASPKAVLQYKENLTSMAVDLDTLAQSGDVYWVFQEPVIWSALAPDNRMITNRLIDLYNDAAAEALNVGSSRIKAFTASRLAALENMSEISDGLRMSPRITHSAAMIFLNSLCNKHLRPNKGLCCQGRPPLTFLQGVALCLFLGSTVLLAVLHFKIKRASGDEESPGKSSASAAGLEAVKAVCGALSRMGLIMVYFYLCDRANVFGKEQKRYSHSAFVIPLLAVFVLGLLCRESAKESRLLNREQTDEWKGWMQLVILIYHVSGASVVVPVYMHVRVLVAAYLFQTGYGHLSFFWLKADFGLSRVCQVLFRLNFLVLVLCAVMDRPYQFYYFVPLVTFWFVTVYSALAAWPRIVQKTANNSVMGHLGLLLKILVLLLIVCLLASFQGLFESVFGVWPVSALFQLNDSVHEWGFRWKLDRFAVLQGMLFAFLYLMLQKKQFLMELKGEYLFSSKVSIPLLLLSLLLLITYSVWACSCTSKAQCNEVHPYISAVPILAFVLLRNIPGFARSIYSSFFAWFGKISLELFICQYHIWLAADSTGVLVLIPGSPALNILVSSFIFVCVAHEVSLITNVLAQALVPKETVAVLRRLGALGLLTALLWGLSFAYSL